MTWWHPASLPQEPARKLTAKTRHGADLAVRQCLWASTSGPEPMSSSKNDGQGSCDAKNTHQCMQVFLPPSSSRLPRTVLLGLEAQASRQHPGVLCWECGR